MATVQVSVELPAGWELADSRMREPRQGECFVDDFDPAFVVKSGGSQRGPRIIVRRAWVWPAWLKCAAVARDGGSCGQWRAYTVVPTMGETGWNHSGPYVYLDPEKFDFDPPPCDDWKQSLRINPSLLGKRS